MWLNCTRWNVGIYCSSKMVGCPDPRVVIDQNHQKKLQVRIPKAFESFWLTEVKFVKYVVDGFVERKRKKKKEFGVVVYTLFEAAIQIIDKLGG